MVLNRKQEVQDELTRNRGKFDKGTTPSSCTYGAKRESNDKARE